MDSHEVWPSPKQAQERDEAPAVTISHCFRKLAKSSNGVINYVAWLGPHPIGTLVRPLGRDPAIRGTIQPRIDRAQRSSNDTLWRLAFHRTRVVSSAMPAMVPARVGDCRCEDSQAEEGQGELSLPGCPVGAQGYAESQGSSGPTFPVKSGKHGQSQGTGIHISSPTFEANPLVPTTCLDDTINMPSTGPWGLLEHRQPPVTSLAHRK